MTNNNSIKEIQNLYDKRISISKDSVKAAGQWGSKDSVPLICNEITKKINISNNDIVIELGCGSGVLGNWINDRCRSYIGIDLSKKMLNAFKIDSNPKKIPEFIQGLTNFVPFCENTFDVVIINGVTMYLHDEKILKNTLDEMKRIVKSKGTIFIGENIIPSGYAWEFSWFQKLSPIIQNFAKFYVNFRKEIAQKNIKFAGKWKVIHKDISPEFIQNYFQSLGKVSQSKSAARTIKEQKLGLKYRGNRRVDFVIKLE